MEDSKNLLGCPLKDECALMGCDRKEGPETEGTWSAQPTSCREVGPGWKQGA